MKLAEIQGVLLNCLHLEEACKSGSLKSMPNKAFQLAHCWRIMGVYRGGCHHSLSYL